MRSVRQFIDRILHVVSWLPLLWKDYDWDYGYLIAMVCFKLTSMADTIERQHIVVSAPLQAKQMRIVREHLRRVKQYDYKYLSNSPIKHSYLDTDNIQQWHWEEAWRKVSKYGRGWWD